MISDATRKAIIALVNVDEGATENERKRVMVALTGLRPSGRTVRIGDAAGMLGVHRNTIRNWIASGRLVGVKGGGQRYIGVTEASLATA